MSRGAGQIEQRISELFAATRDRALSITDIVNHAFNLDGKPPTRAQRLSATRAAHRLVRRTRDADAAAGESVRMAHENTRAALGRSRRNDEANDYWDDEYDCRMKADPAYREYEKLRAFVGRIGRWFRGPWHAIETDYWCATALGNGRLYFHPPDVPVRVWAVSIERAGVIWAEAAVSNVTELNVMARYAGAVARLDRYALWSWWAWWRGVRFVSSRTGRIAQALDELWCEQYFHFAGGSAPPVMQMPLADAIALLGVPVNYTEEDVITAFRREVKKAHPDVGGTSEMFIKLVAARDRLLAALGTSAPPPKMPAYYPSGTVIRYQKYTARSRGQLGQTGRLAHG